VTNFLKNLDKMIDVRVEEIIWCYGVSQKMHKELSKSISTPIKFYEGVPKLDEITTEGSGPKILIIDDLMCKFGSEVVDLFTLGSHHRNISVFNLVQNMFNKGKGMRDISLNSHFLVFFNNPRDRNQFSHFARQVEPNNTKFILEAFRDATSRPYGYLLFECTQHCDEDKRIRTDIFPGQKNIIYVPKSHSICRVL
jgi:hypothetical protein